MCFTKVGCVQRPKHAAQGSCKVQRAKGFASIAGLHCRCSLARTFGFFEKQMISSRLVQQKWPTQIQSLLSSHVRKLYFLLLLLHSAHNKAVECHLTVKSAGIV